MTSTPFLSVVMPVHEGADWIGATFDSVLSGPTEGVEFIVIDSSSTDATSSIAKQYAEVLPIRLERRLDVTPWPAKTNLGMDMASASHACILHQDDLWLSGRIPAVRRWLTAAPATVLHLAPTLIINRHGRTVGRWTCPLPNDEELESDFLLSRLLVQNFVSVPAPVFRRDAWLKCAGMDERLWYTADWDIWAKLSSAGSIVYHDELTTAFRIHGNSLTVTGSRNADEFREQMQTVLARHLNRIPASSRQMIERTGRASIDVNVSLAAASGGSVRDLASAARKVVSLGPSGMRRYLRDSRLRERVLPRLYARLMGAF
jgi:hypothetical protein